MSLTPSLFRSMHLVCLTLLPWMLACSEDTGPSGTATQASAAPQTKAVQALVDPAGPNYVVVGGVVCGPGRRGPQDGKGGREAGE